MPSSPGAALTPWLSHEPLDISVQNDEPFSPPAVS